MKIYTHVLEKAQTQVCQYDFKLPGTVKPPYNGLVYRH